MTDSYRGTGRTTAQVKEIPDEGAVFIVHSSIMQSEVRHLIYEWRGPDALAKTQIIVITDRHDVERLRGYRKKIIVDHAFWDIAEPSLREYLAAWLKAYQVRA